jgi:hypothetical protein
LRTPLDHGRRRHADAPGDLGVGGAGVRLEDGEDLLVDRVEHRRGVRVSGS